MSGINISLTNALKAKRVPVGIELAKAAAVFGRVLNPQSNNLYIRAISSMALVVSRNLNPDREYLTNGKYSTGEIALALDVQSLLDRRERDQNC